MRIVSTSPSMTESVFAIGRGDALVGRSSFCDYPPEAAKVEVIGGFSTPSLEKIVSLSPSLVCGERGPSWPDSVAEIERLGIPTFFPPIDGVRDVPAAIRALGARVDASARAEEVASAVESKVEEVRGRLAERGKLRVVMLFDWKPLVAAGSKSFPDEIIALAGGVNPVSGGPYPKLSTEGLLSLDPDVVLDGSGGAYDESPEALVASIPGLSALRAAKEGRLRRLPGSSALRPGPRIGEGVEVVAKLVHPEAFGA